ncbi:uncharacterized protein LOC129804902 [Phlebotomus papatasi]|uniref:uncharacterized protein LOC129804902 n=1 Tax=Phlebotomus papatasi TaxID=29031 RepID=UPI002483364C|nr:uncharacterized protein LOC129804902 [Phlebotomus papatasi]
MSINRASHLYKIPRTSLRDKLSGRSAIDNCGRSGIHSGLGKEIEKRIVDWVITSADCGFPVTKEGLLSTAEKIISNLPQRQRSGFKRNRPSNKWYYGFLKRNPQISQKKAEYVNRARGSVTEEKIRAWFQDVVEQLGDNIGILNEPKRVFNMDETGFNLAPRGELVLGRKNHHVYVESGNSDKENITTLFAVNAIGTFAPPLTLYKYERMPISAVQSAPPNWGIGKTESGWMTGAAFFEYIANVFLEFLVQQNIQRPVIVFIDGHSSHLTLHLSKFCRENGIVLVALYPNSTHILQPLDVAVFKPLKTKWNLIKREWRIENDGREIRKFDIPTALQKIISQDNMSKNVVSGFRATGLYPFNADAVDYSKIIQRTGLKDTTSDQNIDSDIADQGNQENFVHYFESKIEEKLLSKFRIQKEEGGDWSGDIKAEKLYQVWRAILRDFDEAESLNNMIENSGDGIQEAEAVKTELHPQIEVNPPLECVMKGAFQQIKRWPQSKRTRRSKQDTPTVITTEKWVNFFEKKEEDKLKLIKEKEQKKLLRDKKAIEKKEMLIKKKMTKRQKK